MTRAFAAFCVLSLFLAHGQAKASPSAGAAVREPVIIEIGDFDADGLSDALVALPWADGSAGPGAGRATVLSRLTGAPLLELDGEAGGDAFGASAALLGDWDGDGAPEFALGAPWHDAGGRRDAGRAYVYAGAGGALLRTLDGESAYDGFGSAIAGPGDLDGDGAPELLVGAPSREGPQGWTNGKAYAFSRDRPAPLRAWIGGPDRELFGALLAGLPDRDGDGAPDLAVGAWRSPKEGGESVFAAEAISGATGLAIAELDGAPDPDWLGWTISGAGDLDGDGREDLIVASLDASCVCAAHQDACACEEARWRLSGATGLPLAAPALAAAPEAAPEAPPAVDLASAPEAEIEAAPEIEAASLPEEERDAAARVAALEREVAALHAETARMERAMGVVIARAEDAEIAATAMEIRLAAADIAEGADFCPAPARRAPRADEDCVTFTVRGQPPVRYCRGAEERTEEDAPDRSASLASPVRLARARAPAAP